MCREGLGFRIWGAGVYADPLPLNSACLTLNPTCPTLVAIDELLLVRMLLFLEGQLNPKPIAPIRFLQVEASEKNPYRIPEKDPHYLLMVLIYP